MITKARRALSIARTKSRFALDYLRYRRRYKYPVIYIACPPKTGSTWLSSLLAELLPGYRFYYPTMHAGGRRGDNYDITEELLEELRSKLIVVRSHTPPTAANTEAMDRAFGRYVLLLRDPRDVIVSAYHHILGGRESVFLDYGLDRKLPWEPVPRKVLTEQKETALDLVIERLLPGLVELSDGWFKHQNNRENVHLVRYEDLVRDPTRELLRILDFYGLTIPENTVRRTVDSIDREKTRFKFRKGVAGNWRNELSARQRLACGAIANDFLIRAGYEPSEAGAPTDVGAFE